MSSGDQPPAKAEAQVEAADGPAASDTQTTPTAPGDTPEAPAEEEGGDLDDPYRSILAVLRQELGDGFVESHAQRGDLWVRVRADAWQRTADVCRRQLGFDYFCYLSGIDWMPHTWPNPKVVEGDGEGDAEAEPEQAATDEGWQTGVAGGESRFQVLARLYSTARHLGVTFKADLDDAAPSLATWSEIYPGANWHERETWEMYGFDFVGHPNLIHLYLPSGFEGFPLRKDFPLLSREVKPWPGLVDVEPFPPGAEGETSGEDPAALPAEGD